jgi:hypothetical protein
MSNSSITYSRDVLLNLRFEVIKAQFFPPTVITAAERNLPAACLRDFSYPALRPENRKLFLNLSVISSRIRRLISAVGHVNHPASSSQRAAFASR